MEALEYIEKYVNNELQEEEKMQFENDLITNHQLADELDAYLKTKKAIEASSAARLKEELMNEGKKRLGKSKTLLWSGSHFIRYAAVITLAIISIFFIHQHLSKEEINTATIFEAYYQSPDISWLAERSDGTESLQAWYEGIQLYQDGDFEKATVQFEQAHSSKQFPFKSTSRFLLGICALELGKYTKAIQYFKTVEPESSVYEQSQWYMGLSYLRKGNTSLAKSTFNEITLIEGHFGIENAKKILQKLKDN